HRVPRHVRPCSFVPGPRRDEPSPPMPAHVQTSTTAMANLRLTPDDVRRFRLASSGLDARLPRGGLARAAYAGLQDSAPRAALISLHARVRDVEPSSWEDPSLVQIWFRGGADYVVPRADVGLFTI